MNVKKSSVFGRKQQRWQWHRCVYICINMLINVFLHQLKELGLEHFKGTHRISLRHNVHQHIYQIEHVDIMCHEYA
jgi:hypothetical protein